MSLFKLPEYKKIEVDKIKMLILLAIGIAFTGFIITIIGALLNGIAIFNGIKDLDEGFGLILIGDSIALLGVALMAPIYIYIVGSLKV